MHVNVLVLRPHCNGSMHCSIVQFPRPYRFTSASIYTCTVQSQQVVNLFCIEKRTTCSSCGKGQAQYIQYPCTFRIYESSAFICAPKSASVHCRYIIEKCCNLLSPSMHLHCTSPHYMIRKKQKSKSITNKRRSLNFTVA